MAATDSPFQGAGGRLGLTIWRVEKMTPVPVPLQEYGQFYNGDSYLVLHTSGSEGSKAYDIHFWLGSQTSQDESGAAAIFATELDDALGGTAKQYRQVQNAESKEFFTIFKGGVHYRTGGVQSGFRHVEADQKPPPVLLQVKGKEHARVKEVPLGVDSLNSGDTFILDLYDKLFLWIGKDSNIQEQIRAREVVTALKKARNGQPQEATVDETVAMDETAADFYTALGAEDSSSCDIKPATPDTAIEDGREFSAPHLYKVSDTGPDGKVSVHEVTEPILSQSHLDSSSAFVLAADGWLFVWQGKHASSAERRVSLSMAHTLLQQLNLPHKTPVQLVKQGFEDPSFKQHFEWSANRDTDAMASDLPAEKGTPVADKKAAAGAPGTASEAVAPDTPASTDSSTKTLGTSTPASSAEEGVPAKPAYTNSVAVQATNLGSASKPAAVVPPAPPSDDDDSARGETQKPAVGTAGSGEQPAEPPAQANGHAKLAPARPRVTVPQAPKWQDSGFVPKPLVAEPALPPKVAENLSYIPGKDVLPYEQLRGMRAESGVDMTVKEQYLSPEEFQKVFGKTLSEFQASPKWRQMQAKKAVGLF